MGVKLRERPGKGWWVLIDWHGQRKAKSFGTNKKAAQAFVEKMAVQLKWVEHNGDSYSLRTDKKDMPTVKEYLTQWKDTYAKVQCKLSTYKGYARSIDQHLIPMFGHLLLDQLDREAIRSFIASRANAGKARGTIENHLVPLKTALYQAIDDRLITVKPYRPSRKTLSAEERS